MFIDTCESKSEEPRLFRRDVGLSRDKTRSFRFNRTSVLAPWKRETLSRNWSRWLTSGTAERSRSAALKPAGSSSCEETAPRKSLPAWRTAWWLWAPWWATGRKTSSLSGALRTVIANVAGEVDLKKKNATLSHTIYSILTMLVLILAFGRACIILFLFHYPLLVECVWDHQLDEIMQHVISHLALVEHFSFAADKPQHTADSSTGSRVRGWGSGVQGSHSDF